MYKVNGYDRGNITIYDFRSYNGLFTRCERRGSHLRHETRI